VSAVRVTATPNVAHLILPFLHSDAASPYCTSSALLLFILCPSHPGLAFCTSALCPVPLSHALSCHFSPPIAWCFMQAAAQRTVPTRVFHNSGGGGYCPISSWQLLLWCPAPVDSNVSTSLSVVRFTATPHVVPLLLPFLHSVANSSCCQQCTSSALTLIILCLHHARTAFFPPRTMPCACLACPQLFYRSTDPMVLHAGCCSEKYFPTTGYTFPQSCLPHRYAASSCSQRQPLCTF
jgi:hypothetical protein